MDIGLIKIVYQIINAFNLQDHRYIPLDKKLGALTPYDFISDDTLSELAENTRLNEKVSNMEVLGVAIPFHSKEFLKIPEGRALIEHLINNSTAKDNVNIDILIGSNYGNISPTDGYDDSRFNN